MNKDASPAQEIHKLLNKRWSPRSFNPNSTLSKEQLISLAEAARWAPSCFGDQPWGFIFCPRDDEQAWAKALECLVEGNQAWAKNASLLVFAAARPNFIFNGEPNKHNMYDTGAAAFSLTLQAEALGLRSHQMGGFIPDKVAKNFFVPGDWTCISAIVIGTQAPAENLVDEKMIEMEHGPRTRRPLGSKFFVGRWDKPLDGKN